jgi:hypothetical protein
MLTSVEGNAVQAFSLLYTRAVVSLEQGLLSLVSIDRVFRRDSPLTRSRRSTGSGGESSSMLTSVEGNAVQGRMLL